MFSDFLDLLSLQSLNLSVPGCLLFVNFPDFETISILLSFFFLFCFSDKRARSSFFFLAVFDNSGPSPQSSVWDCARCSDVAFSSVLNYALECRRSLRNSTLSEHYPRFVDKLFIDVWYS